MNKLVLIATLIFYLNAQTQTADIIKGTNSLNVTLINQGNYAFLMNISIGTPAQNFTIIVDTGSNILWVPYYKCPYCDMTGGFNPNTSPAGWNNTGTTYTQYYGSGHCSGIVAWDTVRITKTPISDNFEMMFATSASGFTNGIMGLSNNQTFLDLFQVGFQNKQLQSPIYGLALQPQPYISYLIYSQIDQKINSSVVWVKSTDKYRWMLQLNSVVFGNKTQTIGNIKQGILDSGTSCLVLESNLYQAYVNDYASSVCTCNIAQQSCQCPCRPTSTQLPYLPNINLGFQGVTVSIPFQNFMPDYYVKSSGYCSLCLGSIDPSQANFMVFGDPALMSMIALFDKQTNSIGIYTP